MNRARPWILWYVFASAFLAIGSLPVALSGHLAGVLLVPPALVPLARTVLLASPFLACWVALRNAPGSARERRIAWAFSLACAGFCEVLHYWITDTGHYFPTAQFADNTGWQLWVHSAVLRLSPWFEPHSYRFLPDSIVALFQAFTGDFAFARTAYRLLFNSLLFATIFRYSRIYLAPVSAVAVMLVIVLLYPVSILRYAGQLADPLSHLSFAVCLYCLAAGYGPGFGPSLVVGIFAKESVVVMALCRAFQGGSCLRSAARALGYLVAALAAAVAIRLRVNHGHLAYHAISGTGFQQARYNLDAWADWVPLYLATLGVLLPGAALGWRLMDRAFRSTCLLVTIAVVVSSLLFSWLVEVRNLIPALIPLAIVNLKYVETRWLDKGGAASASSLPQGP
jgi:hypothetical protein